MDALINFMVMTMTEMYISYYQKNVRCLDSKTAKLYLMEHLNMCYKSLIVKDDPVIIDKFEQICQGVYSPVYILKVAMTFGSTFIDFVDSNKTKDITYPQLMQLLEMSVSIFVSQLKSKESQIFTGTSGDIPIDRCNPDQPLFKIH